MTMSEFYKKNASDKYELVALWNRDYLPKTASVVQESKLENYGGLYDFEKENLRSRGYAEEDLEDYRI